MKELNKNKLIYQSVELEELELIHLDYDYYLYSIQVAGIEVGRMTFRLGSDEKFILDGHIGYEIEEAYRGHHYAYQACMAVVPEIQKHYDHILITCDDDNIASRKTILKLGAVYLESRGIPKNLRDYYPGCRQKEIYLWKVK